VLQILRDADSLRFPPGTRNGYSNSGYVLLGLVIEKISAVSYGAYLQREFFGPFGMTATTVADGHAPLPANRAIGYRKAGAGWELSDYQSSTTGAGGIYTSVDDLYRFWAAMRDGKVVSAQSMERARTMQLLSNGKGTPYGMGWLAESDGRGPLKDKWYVAAVGQLRGFWSLLKWYHHDDFVIIWTSNAAENTLFDALRAIPGMVLAP
jgi:CubicO group peptidase (beta-lactamase class C family)